MTTNIAAMIQAQIKAAAEQTNMNEASTAPSFSIPEEGVCIATLVGYIETGKSEGEYKGAVKIRNNVSLLFELSGGKNKPIDVNGKKVPHIIRVTENLSLNEKANFFKLFKKLNYDGTATHCAELIGKHWLVTVHHKPNEKDPKIIYANLYNDDGYTFRPPVQVIGDALNDPENVREVPVAAPEVLTTEQRVFLWDYASIEQWDSLYIDGEYEAKDGKPAKSKNYWQNLIRAAINFDGSPIAELLSEGALDLSGVDLGAVLPDPALAPETPVVTAEGASPEASVDPLAGIA